ncbi:MAG: lsr operon transcriptional repressor [Kosmotogales bacterium]|nr:lsr operon transcriptional repressor [Kosmotogales bacterium]
MTKSSGGNGKWLDSHEMMVRVSWCYYKLKMTQSEIAKKFNTNRVKIMKILEKAADENIVEIKIKDSSVNLLNIEKKLIDKFGLKDSVVVPIESKDKKVISKQLGIAASQYISMILQDDDVIGIGWGESVSNTIRHLVLDHVNNLYIVSLSGGVLPLISDTNFFGRYSSIFKVLPTPLIFSNQKIAEEVCKEPEVIEIFNMWALTNHLLLGIGAPDNDATIVKKGYLSESQLALLRQKGAVGDILGQYFDQDGNIIDFETNQRIISFDISKLKVKQNVIAIAGGPKKVQAIAAAIKGGYLSTLITDELTAKQLLKE